MTDRKKEEALNKCDQIICLYQTFDKYVNLRQNLPPELKMLLWVDRFQLASIAMKSLAHMALEHSFHDIRLSETEKAKFKEAHDKIDICSDLIVNEFQSILLHVNDMTKSVKRVEDKLDTVLQGPDYEEGHTIMKEAESHLKFLSLNKDTF